MYYCPELGDHTQVWLVVLNRTTRVERRKRKFTQRGHIRKRDGEMQRLLKPILLGPEVKLMAPFTSLNVRLQEKFLLLWDPLFNNLPGQFYYGAHIGLVLSM